MIPLSAKRRSELRSEAHKLGPIVFIGDKGLTDEVIAEIDRSLRAHELIKVRAASAERKARDEWLETICSRLDAHPVQQIGKVFVIYRERPQEPARAVAQPPEPPRRRARPTVVGTRGKERQRARDARTQLLRDIREMRAKGKIPATAKVEAEEEVKRTSRPRSRTPSPRPESGPPRRRPRTSR